MAGSPGEAFKAGIEPAGKFPFTVYLQLSEDKKRLVHEYVHRLFDDSRPKSEAPKVKEAGDHNKSTVTTPVDTRQKPDVSTPSSPAAPHSPPTKPLSPGSNKKYDDLRGRLGNLRVSSPTPGSVADHKTLETIEVAPVKPPNFDPPMPKPMAPLASPPPAQVTPGSVPKQAPTQKIASPTTAAQLNKLHSRPPVGSRPPGLGAHPRVGDQSRQHNAPSPIFAPGRPAHPVPAKPAFLSVSAAVRPTPSAPAAHVPRTYAPATPPFGIQDARMLQGGAIRDGDPGRQRSRFSAPMNTQPVINNVFDIDGPSSAVDTKPIRIKRSAVKIAGAATLPPTAPKTSENIVQKPPAAAPTAAPENTAQKPPTLTPTAPKAMQKAAQNAPAFVPRSAVSAGSVQSTPTVTAMSPLQRENQSPRVTTPDARKPFGSTGAIKPPASPLRLGSPTLTVRPALNHRVEGEGDDDLIDFTRSDTYQLAGMTCKMTRDCNCKDCASEAWSGMASPVPSLLD